MSEFEKGRESRPREKSVRNSVPTRRPPPAAGLFGKYCPTEPAPRRDCRAAPTMADFKARFVSGAVHVPAPLPRA